MKAKDSIKQVNGIKRVTLITGTLLLIPFIGRWPWGIFDYLVMAILIFVAGIGIDWITRTVSPKYKVFAILIVLITFFIIWAQLAVGLLGRLFSGDWSTLGWN